MRTQCFFMWTVIRLGECPGWSESSLGAQIILLVLSWGVSLFVLHLYSQLSYDRHKTAPNWSLKAGHFAKMSAHSKALCLKSYIVEINWPFKTCENLESLASISEDMFESSCTHEPSFSLHVTLIILKWCMPQILFMWQSMIWSNIWVDFCFTTLQHM